MTCLHPSLPSTIDIYIGHRMTKFTESNCFPFLTHATCPVYYRSLTPICVGYVTGTFYQSGIVQEYLCP